MAAEIERKFRLNGLPSSLSGARAAIMQQGYLAVQPDGTEVRLRDNGRRRSLTVKSGEGMMREEREVEITAAQFRTLWPATASRRLVKHRYLQALGRDTVQIDVYAGALQGLILAEVEFASEEAARRFQPPAWFGEELTDDPAYRSRTLAWRRPPVH